MVTMTLVSIPLMEKRGRRFLHLFGLGGLFLLTLVMTVAFVVQPYVDWLKYVSIVAMMLFIVFFALGPGSIPWLIVAELFSQGPRPSAVSVSVLVNWSANCAVGQGFPYLFEVYGYLSKHTDLEGSYLNDPFTECDKELDIFALQRVSGLFLVVHVYVFARDQKQEGGRDNQLF